MRKRSAVLALQVEYDDGDVEHLHLAAEEVRLQVRRIRGRMHGLVCIF